MRFVLIAFLCAIVKATVFNAPDSIVLLEGLQGSINITKVMMNNVPVYLFVTSNSSDINILNQTIIFQQSAEAKTVQILLESDSISSSNPVRITLSTNSTIPEFNGYSKAISITHKASCGIVKIKSCLLAPMFVTATFVKSSLISNSSIQFYSSSPAFYVYSQSLLPSCPSIAYPEGTTELTSLDPPRLYGESTTRIYHEIRSPEGATDCDGKLVVYSDDENMLCSSNLQVTTICTVNSIKPWQISIIVFSTIYGLFIIAFIVIQKRRVSNKS